METHYAGNDPTFYYVPVDDHFSPSPRLKAIEPFRSRAEKLFRRINSFALIRTLALCQQSHHPHRREGGIH